jgi:hypothetical protein
MWNQGSFELGWISLVVSKVAQGVWVALHTLHVACFGRGARNRAALVPRNGPSVPGYSKYAWGPHLTRYNSASWGGWQRPPHSFTKTQLVQLLNNGRHIQKCMFPGKNPAGSYICHLELSTCQSKVSRATTFLLNDPTQGCGILFASAAPCFLYFPCIT